MYYSAESFATQRYGAFPANTKAEISKKVYLVLRRRGARRCGCKEIYQQQAASGGQLYENRAYEAGKDHDIWFDEKDPLIHIRTHNTDLKNRLTAYAGQHPDQCRQTDADPETGYMEFEIAKGRLTAPYSEERRRAASVAAKKSGVHRKGTGR